MKKLGLFLFAASLSFGQSSPVQLIQVPPKPTCNPTNIFDGGTCRDSINAYNQALKQRQVQEIQLYVTRQKELASAPLQQQISDQQAQIKKLQDRMQVDLAAAIQDKATAHREGLQYGIELGAGGTVILFGLILAVRKLAGNFTVTKKPQSRAASA